MKESSSITAHVHCKIIIIIVFISIQIINVINYFICIFSCANIPFASKWLKSVISIFPHTILCRIVIRPNQNNAILTPMPNKPTNEKTVGDEELQVLNNNNTLQRLKKQMPMEFKMQRYSTMDAKIMKKIKIVMDECNERFEKEMKEEKLSQQLQSMEKQLKMLTDLFIAQNNIKH